MLICASHLLNNFEKEKITTGQKTQERGKSVQKPTHLSDLWQQRDMKTGQKEAVENFTDDTILHYTEKTADKTGYCRNNIVHLLKRCSFLLYKKQLYREQHHKLKRHPNLIDLSICPISNNLHQFKYSRRVLQKAEEITLFAAK